jgi:RNA polymerase sigma-70 factor (ECF subfamily)
VGLLPQSDPRSDAELIRAINQGDPAAFEALYYRYRDWVVRLATRFAGDSDEALDVLQETFAYLLRRTPGLRLSARMTTVLYPVVKHISLAVRRKRLRLISPDSDAEIPAAPAAEGDGVRAGLAEVMAGLPDEQREIVLMRFVDDMDLAEIAGALGLPIGTVKSRLHRALERLRRDPRTQRYFGV